MQIDRNINPTAPRSRLQRIVNLLHQMPKVEIHTHLIGTADAETIYSLARRNRVELPAASLEEWKLFYEFRDFTHFIEVYATARGSVARISNGE